LFKHTASFRGGRIDRGIEAVGVEAIESSGAEGVALERMLRRWRTSLTINAVNAQADA